MSPIKYEFAKSLLKKIEESKTLSKRQKRINNCLKKVQKELFIVIDIMKQITENEEMYQKINIIKNFCNEFDNLWLKSSDDNDTVNYDDSNDSNDSNDILNTGFCEGYF